MPEPIRSKRFFQRSALILAKDLLGCVLHVKHRNQIVSGMIVETESYHESDPASHSYGGPKNRNRIMFSDGGFGYVYFIYGNHFCFNVVAGKAGIGEAVLIRALEPINGLNIMRKNRKKTKIEDLCSGPGKLCQALGINKTHNGVSLLESDSIYISRSKKIKPANIVASRRIGITKGVEHLERFHLRDSKFISRK